ncbi:MAG TPA: GTPase domain-containing protein [Aquabacterium sp.]|nr:GTPase domain-containing protein [Aquabacterium sp.]HQC99871.1 GTPase domain-containing protein [Aquabacterium sp.]
MSDTTPATLSISLVAHTNVGKTTLARTLLGRDVGEVRDEAHVTAEATPHTLLESAAGDRLLLWDTPGFGDSERLARRLAQAGNPLGWLLTEVWDRWRDRAFWASQHAVRHVLGQTDVALYLVNAAEAPEDAAYLAPELQVLGLLHKPVLVLLNQLGAPGSAADEAAQLQRWQAHLDALAAQSRSGGMAGIAGNPQQRMARVQAVLPLDAFARCWVQEAVLLQAVAAALPAAQQGAMVRLTDAWAQHQRGVWRKSMTLLAERLARAALDREVLQGGAWRAPLQRLGAALGLPTGDDPQALAMAALAERLDAAIRRSTDALISLHGLGGAASGDVLDQLARHFARREPVSEGKAALWGGAVAGALAGLKADIATGGLTLGGGLLAGGVLGALGAAGAARGVNRIRGLHQPLLAWDDTVLDALLRSALLGYLAVAHHGRGRGDWQPVEPPAAWGEAVDAALAGRRDAAQALWRERAAWLAQPAMDTAPADWQDELTRLLTEAVAKALRHLYPEAARLAGL